MTYMQILLVLIILLVSCRSNTGDVKSSSGNPSPTPSGSPSGSPKAKFSEVKDPKDLPRNNLDIVFEKFLNDESAHLIDQLDSSKIATSNALDFVNAYMKMLEDRQKTTTDYGRLELVWNQDDLKKYNKLKGYSDALTPFAASVESLERQLRDIRVRNAELSSDLYWLRGEEISLKNDIVELQNGIINLRNKLKGIEPEPLPLSQDGDYSVGQLISEGLDSVSGGKEKMQKFYQSTRELESEMSSKISTRGGELQVEGRSHLAFGLLTADASRPQHLNFTIKAEANSGEKGSLSLYLNNGDITLPLPDNIGETDYEVDINISTQSFSVNGSSPLPFLYNRSAPVSPDLGGTFGIMVIDTTIKYVEAKSS